MAQILGPGCVRRDSNRESVIGPRDPELELAVPGNQFPGHDDFRVFRRETIVEDGFTDLPDPHPVSRGELDANQAAVQVDVDRSNAGNLFDGHAHGVCTDRSVHAKRRDVNLAKFRLEWHRRQDG